MSTKTKLISTISVFCMVLAMLVTGVWAVSTANITLGGTVSFTADNVNAVITGSITGIQETVDIKPLTYTAKTQPEQAELNSWNNNVSFDSGNLITMTITVQNKSTERSLFVTVTDNTTTSNITKTFSADKTGVESGKEYEVVASGTITYTMTMKVTSLDQSASATYSYNVDLKDANYKESLAPDYEKVYGFLTFGNYDDENGTVSVTGNSISQNNFDLIIPEKISKDGKNYSVTEIGSSAFEGCSQIVSITIPDSVTTLGDAPFCECNNLVTATIGSGLKETGAEVLYCDGLKTVTIYATEVPSWGPGVAPFPFTLEYLYVPAGSEDAYETSLAGYESGDYNFDNLQILGIPTIGDAETDYGYLTFGNYDDENWTVSVTGSSISQDSFDLVIPEKISKDGKNYTVTSIGSCAIESLQIISVIIPDSVTTLGTEAFCECYNLTTAVIGKNAKIWGTESMYSNTGLKTVTIYSTEVPDWNHGTAPFPFTLEYLYVPAGSVEAYETSLAGFSIGESNFANLQILAIGSVPEDLNSSLFTFGDKNESAQTVSITGHSITESINLVIPEKVTLDGVEYTITKIGSNAFANCDAIVSVTIPSSVTTVGTDSFSGCANLEMVILKEGVEILEDAVFCGCGNLETVYMPVSITTIQTEMFEETSLRDIYYAGTESDWDSIAINSYNDVLDTVTMHWSSTY